MSKKKNQKIKKTGSKQKATRTTSSPKAKVATSSKSENTLLPMLVALIVTFLVYIPSLSNQFVNWDDDVNILENPNLEVFNAESVKNIFHLEKGNVIGNYNPLTIFTFAVEKHFVGENPKLYHINNLILHLVCVFLVYRLMLLLQLSPIAAMFVALLFGIHPMRVESVAWVTERKDVLFGAFFLGALCLYTRYIKEGMKDKKLIFFCIGLFILSLLSKIQAVALPLTMLAVDYYYKRPLKLNLIIEKIPFFLLSLAFGLLGIYSLKMQGSLDDDVTQYGFAQRLLIGGYSWVVYLIKSIVPYKMVCMYPYPKTLTWHFYVTPFIALGTLAGAFWAFKNEKRGLFFGFLVFFFNVVFMLQILGAGQGFIADRFTYIPYLGLFFIVGYYLNEFQKSDSPIANYLKYGLGAYLLVSAFLSFKQIKTWENGGTLWTHAIENLETTTLPYNNRGNYYRDKKKDFKKAIVDYDKAVSISPNKASQYNSRGKTHFDMGNVPKAIADYRKAIQLSEGDEKQESEAEFYVNLGAALGASGDINGAIQALNKGVETDPEFANSYLNRSLAFNQTGQYEKAHADIEKYLGFKPYNAEMWYELGLVSRIIRKYDQSISGFTKAIQYGPNNKNVGLFYYQRGRTYATMNQAAKAKADLNQAKNMGVKIEEDMVPYL